MTRRIVEGSYARLIGLRDSTNIDGLFLSMDFAIDYSSILDKLRASTDDEFEGFNLPQNALRQHQDPAYQVNKVPLQSKVRQLISYLESVHNASTRIVEIGSAYNLIQDDELKSRCSDLLSAATHFDRVINQATQVLEERVRRRAPSLGDLTGVALVNRAIRSDPTESQIRFSENPSEQEGYANLFRGVVGAFRNPSHHRFLENVSREQALQVCAFIDNLLALLEQAEVSK